MRVPEAAGPKPLERKLRFAGALIVGVMLRCILFLHTGDRERKHKEWHLAAAGTDPSRLDQLVMLEASFAVSRGALSPPQIARWP
jgi:hypothetical protein